MLSPTSEVSVTLLTFSTSKRQREFLWCGPFGLSFVLICPTSIAIAVIPYELQFCLLTHVPVSLIATLLICDLPSEIVFLSPEVSLEKFLW
jgi:hypothetical protein